jgi:ferredoxin
MKQVQIRLLPMEWQFPAAHGQSVLAAAEAAGIVLPSACRNGTCRTCICLLEHGQVRYTVDWPGLSADEKKEGWILPCVALAQEDLQLRVPAARWQRTGSR